MRMSLKVSDPNLAISVNLQKLKGGCNVVRQHSGFVPLIETHCYIVNRKKLIVTFSISTVSLTLR